MYQKRLNKLRLLLEKEKIDNFLVSDPENIYYLSGFNGLSPKERECFLLITNNSQFVITDSRYYESAKVATGFETKITEKGQNYYQLINNIALATKIKSLHFEETDLKFFEYSYFRALLEGIEFKPASQTIETLRVIKTSAEIKKIKVACQITSTVLQEATMLLNNTEQTEESLAAILETLAKEKGASALAFPPIVASGSSSAEGHYQTSKKPIKSGPLLIDFGVTYKHYLSDLTRTFFINRRANNDVLSKFKDVYERVQEANQTTMAKIVPGMIASEAYELAVEVFKKYNLEKYFTHSLGHGVGLQIHENPRLSSNSIQQLEENMVFTIEPGLYFTGKFGVRIEDTVLLTKKGCKPLAKFDIPSYLL
jgi:Xaa-Pro aminopeptidase